LRVALCEPSSGACAGRFPILSFVPDPTRVFERLLPNDWEAVPIAATLSGAEVAAKLDSLGFRYASQGTGNSKALLRTITAAFFTGVGSRNGVREGGRCSP
jgi:hypothetical protein